MKKKMIVLLAGALMALSASSAMAAFSNGDLIRVVYNHGGSVEVATDLGSISSLLSGGAVSADTFSLSSITGATSAADLYVAYFASNYVASSGNQAYVGAATAPVTGSRQYSSFNTKVSNMDVYYKNINATATTILGDQGINQAYAKGLTNAGALFGGLGGYIPAASGEENLADLIARGGQTTIYGFYNQSGTTGVTTGAATKLVLTTTFNSNGIGQTTTTPTPIPAAAYLLGSGLMGLLGLRRKSIKA